MTARFSPAITVAICTWNRATVLRRTLEQLTKVRVPNGVTWELLVVNNKCTDDTDRVCHEFTDRLPLRLLHEPKAGKAHALNLAVRESRGEYIAWTDDDVLVDPLWLQVLLDGFARYQADWIFGSSEPEWPHAAPTWYSPRFSGYFATLDYGAEPFVVNDTDHSFYGLNVAGTRAAHVALNGFRTDFGPKGNEGGLGEDVDMFERALRADMKIIYLPGARVRHIISPNRMSKQYHRMRHWQAVPLYYRRLDEFYASVPWLLGIPRFFFATALEDAAGYVRTLLTRDTSGRFHHELMLLRFIRLIGESAKQGFSKRPQANRAEVAQPPTTGIVNL